MDTRTSTHRLRIERMGTQSVHRLGRESHQTTVPQNGRGVGDAGRVGGQQTGMPAIKASHAVHDHTSGTPPSGHRHIGLTRRVTVLRRRTFLTLRAASGPGKPGLNP